MRLPKPAQRFLERLQARPDDQLETFVGAELLDGVPHIFHGNPHELRAFRAHIANALAARDADIHVVGSARLGFSLNPNHYFRPLLATSDVDVVVIHPGLFDFAWYSLLNWHYHILGKNIDGDTKWATKRRREVWKGWFEPHHWNLAHPSGVALSLPDALKPVRDFATTWFTTFTSLGRYRHSEIATRQVSARLYRSAAHVKLYHANGLRVLRREHSTT